MFEVWNDAQWVDGNKIYTFFNLEEALRFVIKVTIQNSNESHFKDILDFWNRVTEEYKENSIIQDGWAIQKIA